MMGREMEVMVLVDWKKGGNGVGERSSRQADVTDFDVLVRPLVEELDGADFLGHFLGEHLVPAGVLDLDFAVVGHGCGGRWQCTWEFRGNSWGSRDGG